MTLAGLVMLGCSPVQAPQTTIEVTVSTADETISVDLPLGSTAEEALDAAGVEIGELDRSEPPLYTLLTDGNQVRLVRVSEEFDIEEVVIPFESQTLRNESLPEGERRLIQAGVNGVQEITYRIVFEDAVEISRNPVKSVTLQEAVPEIVMIGSQNAFTPVSLPGTIVYLSGGNAWLMEGASGERRPVVTSGDLDGRVFSLSPDGEWLLFTRAEDDDELTINSLWVARLDDPELLVDLEARNIIHFADWVPAAVLQIAYSTVEPRSTAPGWQANNDLVLVSFSPTGWVSDPEQLVDANAGGYTAGGGLPLPGRRTAHSWRSPARTAWGWSILRRVSCKKSPTSPRCRLSGTGPGCPGSAGVRTTGRCTPSITYPRQAAGRRRPPRCSTLQRWRRIPTRC